VIAERILLRRTVLELKRELSTKWMGKQEVDQNFIDFSTAFRTELLVLRKISNYILVKWL
jgi:hypothetical protein